MTDKQIIIDGVDISGCPYYIDSDGSCSSQDCECIKCIHNVCFYKDYKAKEQECEELTSQRDKFEFGNNILEHERNNYKQALDEIEKQVKAINNECFYDASCDCNNCDMKNGCSYYRKFKILDIINSVKDKNVPHKAKDGE